MQPSSFSYRLPLFVKPVFLLVMLTYVPPFLWYLLTGQGIYQHGYHLLLVLLASGPATGATIRSTKLATFLLASLLSNVLILLLDVVGIRLNMGVSLGALVLLAITVGAYYAIWATVLVLGWRSRRK